MSAGREPYKAGDVVAMPGNTYTNGQSYAVTLTAETAAALNALEGRMGDVAGAGRGGRGGHAGTGREVAPEGT